ncbi:DUF624 domain-containing protein [Bacillus mangrovi]|uniref:DUF624 domain-containing protein n=1 Tax=Metabacillus mangrovi TaxID=1491830 RepID=A0A7X2V5L7_9BACI|nr:YesL family protein [Metabacillus mangrovi]MTH54942.1 DUF624 domain-containing protein [Metabacillus mangrovi]
MNIVNKRNSRFISKAADFMLVNVIWFISCLPIITIFPATAALFAVVRQHYLKKESEAGLMKTYWNHFHRTFRQHWKLAIGWTAAAMLIAADLFWAKAANQVIFETALSVLVFLFLLVSLYIFAAAVHFDADSKGVIRNSLIILVAFPLKAIFLGLSLYLFFMLILAFPAAILMLPSLYTALVFGSCMDLFTKYTQQADYASQ